MTAPALPIVSYSEDSLRSTPGTAGPEPGIVVGGDDGAKPTAFSITSLPGPNLNELQEATAPQPLSFRHNEVPAREVYNLNHLYSAMFI